MHSHRTTISRIHNFYGLTVTMTTIVVLCGTNSAHGQVKPFDDPCAQTRTPHRQRWTPTEMEVAKVICNAAGMPHSTSQAGNSKTQTAPLQLSGPFVSALLVSPTLRDGAARQISLSGAQITGTIDLRGAHIVAELRIYDCDIAGAIDMSVAVFDRDVSFQGSRIRGDVDLSDSIFRRSLYLGNESLDRRSRPEQSSVPQNISKVHLGPLTLDHAHIAHDLFIKYAITGPISGTQLVVDGNLSIKECEASSIDFRYPAVARQLELVGCIFAVRESTPEFMVSLPGGTIGDGVFLDRSDIQGDVLLSGDIKGDVTLFGTSLGGLRMDGAQVTGSITFGSNHRDPTRERHTSWKREARIDLRNASVGGLLFWIDRSHELQTYWPTRVLMEGLSLQRITVSDENLTQDRFIVPPSSEFVAILRTQAPYVRDVYQLFATALSSQGNTDVASDILYAGRIRERQQLWLTRRWGEWLFSVANDMLIGYSYRLHRVLYWILAAVLIGAIVFRTGAEARALSMPYGLAFSFDMLLPVISLRKVHHDIDLHGWRRYYFYAHKIAGYVFAGFVAAALAGFTR
jgi:hypothetical protein